MGDGAHLSRGAHRLNFTKDQFNAVGGHLAAVLTDLGVPDDDMTALVGLIGSLQPEVVGR